MFPPKWSVGQTWLVEYRQKPVRDLGETEDSSALFLFHVVAFEHGCEFVDNVGYEPSDPSTIERQIFGMHPFGLREMWTIDQPNRSVTQRFVGDGDPCCESCRCGTAVPSEKFLDDGVGRLEKQSSEPMENGIRFYFFADTEHPTVIEWLAGEPWWSRLYELGDPARSLPGLGTDIARLVRASDGTPISPPTPTPVAAPDAGTKNELH